MDDLRELNRRVCRHVWELATVKGGQAGIGALSPRLLLPSYSSGGARLSEQEARFVYTDVLNGTNLFYSVETPTKEQYSFSGASSRSASSDLTIYERLAADGEFRALANVELKAHNCTAEAVAKDLQKLFREDVDGIWFHVFAKTQAGSTIDTLMAKFCAAFRGKVPKFSMNADYAAMSSNKILFVFCVYEEGWAILKSMDLSANPDPKTFFAFHATYDPAATPPIKANNDWEALCRGS